MPTDDFGGFFYAIFTNSAPPVLPKVWKGGVLTKPKIFDRIKAKKEFSMAKRRMLSISIIETDKFYNLTAGAQALYLHLNLNADDDGVVDRVKLITNQMRTKKSSYNELVLGGYIIELEEGLIVITHWHQHNQIRKERYVKGEYLDRLSSLSLQENGRFVKGSSHISGDKCVPQDSIGNNREAKISTDNERSAEHREEQKREENSISFLHTNIHNPVASLPRQQATESVSYPDENTIIALSRIIKLYFMKNYSLEHSDKFIEYCDSVNWQIDGTSINGLNYKAIIDRWMTKK